MHHKTSRLGLSSLFAEGKASLQEQSDRRWEPSLRGEPRAENQEAKLFFFPIAPFLIKAQPPEPLLPDEPQIRARFGRAARDPRYVAAPTDYATAACRQRINPPAPRDALASRCAKCRE